MFQLLKKAMCFGTPFKKSVLIIIFISCISTSYADSFYWVGGSGSWVNYSEHWATSSGGQIFHNYVPTSGDDVFFDQYSFPSGGTVTASMLDITCRNMTWSQTSGNSIFNGVLGSFFISGSLTLNSNVNWNYHGDIYFVGAGIGNTISTGNAHLQDIYFQETAAEWILQSAIYCNSLSLMSGYLNTNGQSLYCKKNITISGDRLELGSSDIHCLFWANYIDSDDNMNTSFDAGTSTIHCFQFSGIHQSYDRLEMLNISHYSIFNANGCSFENAVFPAGETHFYESSDNLFRKALFKGAVTIKGNTVFKNATFQGNCSINGVNSFDTLTFDNPGKTVLFEAGKKQTVNYTFQINSIEGNKITLKSSVEGLQAMLSSAAPELCFEYLALKDIGMSGGTKFKAGAQSNDLGNNSGFLFTSCAIAENSIANVYTMDLPIANTGIIISNVYPNPASSMASFEIECVQSSDFNIEIMDVTGHIHNNAHQVIGIGKTIVNIDLNDFVTGIYFIKITDQQTGNTVLKKIIKE